MKNFSPKFEKQSPNTFPQESLKPEGLDRSDGTDNLEPVIEHIALSLDVSDFKKIKEAYEAKIKHLEDLTEDVQFDQFATDIHLFDRHLKDMIYHKELTKNGAPLEIEDDLKFSGLYCILIGLNFDNFAKYADFDGSPIENFIKNKFKF